MLIPIEYRIRCDNKGSCCNAQPAFREGRVGAWKVLLAHSKTEARRLAEAQGWARVKLGNCGPMVDLCPECAAKP